MATSLKEYLTTRLKTHAKMYVEDLEASDEAILGAALGGSARTPYDFTYEVVVVNRRVSMRMKGEDPGILPQDGWIKAPAEFCSKAVAVKEFRESADDVIAQFEKEPEGQIERVIPLPKGETSPLDLVTLSVHHWNYHDAQINYVQSLSGDEKVHWVFE